MRTIGLICVAALLTGGVALPANAQLSLTVEEDRLVVSNVTPGAEVVVRGVMQAFPGDTMHVRVPFLIGQSADRETEISLRLADSARPVPEHSVFVVVELSTGRVALGAPAGTRPIVGAGHRAARVVELTPGSTGVAIKARRVSAMLVRPGVGVWQKTVGDGGTSDADGRGDGTVLLHPSGFARVTDASAPPTELRDGDVVVAINTYTREVHVVEMVDSSQRSSGEGL